MRKGKIIFIILGIFFFPGFSYGLGLSVSPPELHISTSPRRATGSKLLVKNSSDGVAVFEAYPDEFEGFVKTIPANFILESGQEREVTIRAEPPIAGRFQTTVSIVARSVLEGSFNAGGGLKIPLYIESKENNSRYLSYAALIFSNKKTLIGAAAVLIIVVLFYALGRWIRRRKEINLNSNE